MTIRVSLFSAGVLVAGLALLGSSDSRAGSLPGQATTPFCVATPGTSYCLGNFAGFQQSSDPNAYVGMTSGTNGNGFSAELNGQSYICTVSSTLYPDVLAAWAEFNASRNGYFFIGWDQQGFCSMLIVFNTSYYSN